MQAKKVDVRKLALVGVLSALVFALSLVSIPIGDISRIHFGNIMCLVAGTIFGPVVGGLSAGIGSMLYDFTNPLYIAEFWITFLTKFAMGYMAGLISRKFGEKLPVALRYVLPALAGSLTYVLLYMGKTAIFQAFVYGLAPDAVWGLVISKGAISAVNGVIAVVVCALFAPVLRAALDASGLFKRTKPS